MKLCLIQLIGLHDIRFACADVWTGLQAIPYTLGGGALLNVSLKGWVLFLDATLTYCNFASDSHNGQWHSDFSSAFFLQYVYILISVLQGEFTRSTAKRTGGWVLYSALTGITSTIVLPSSFFYILCNRFPVHTGARGSSLGRESLWLYKSCLQSLEASSIINSPGHKSWVIAVIWSKGIAQIYGPDASPEAILSGQISSPPEFTPVYDLINSLVASAVDELDDPLINGSLAPK